MLTLTRRVGEEVSFSDSYGPIATLAMLEVKGDEALVFTFTPLGEPTVRHEVKRKDTVALSNGAGVMGSVRVTDLIGGVRARMAFDFPREIKLA